MQYEINGAPAGPDDLVAAMTGYGHFTAMQVSGGRVRKRASPSAAQRSIQVFTH
ncbi:hypothetical protein [Amycolatopsis jiangsuensis]|uniref:Uncharacterized protein n=1 Tax=Amycolatopsis jiangsuensis TaxID=1181879 RepID=A0A840IPV3_9PSEU|nr:hypothetical protein [Amycolatopsis jiangsuensis]MBB4683208.1 hypothetical protein [Amycolatopsis jiangsuensis]